MNTEELPPVVIELNWKTYNGCAVCGAALPSNKEFKNKLCKICFKPLIEE